MLLPIHIEVTNLSCFQGCTTIRVLQLSDSFGIAKKHSLHLRWGTHKCSVISVTISVTQ